MVKTNLLAVLPTVAGVIATAVSENATWLERAVDKFGFPIAVCGVCFAYIYKTHKEYREDYKQLHDTHAQEVKALTATLAENTAAIRSLRDVLDDCHFIDSKEFDIMTGKGDKL